MMRASIISNELMLIGVLILLAVCPIFLVAQQIEILDNSKIIELVKAGYGDQVIIPKIRSSRMALDSSESSLLEMKAAGVSDAVIVALLERSAISIARADVCPANQIKIPGNTELKIITTQKISGKKVRIGQIIMLEVAEDTLINETVVIGKGTLVKAIVSEARKPGMIGRSGRLSVRFESTKAGDGQEIKLRSAKSGEGGDNFGTALTLSVFWGVGLLIPGKNAEIKAGTLVTAFTDEPKCVAVSVKP